MTDPNLIVKLYAKIVKNWLAPSGPPPVVTQVIQDQEVTIITTDQGAAIVGPETISAIKEMNP